MRGGVRDQYLCPAHAPVEVLTPSVAVYGGGTPREGRKFPQDEVRF